MLTEKELTTAKELLARTVLGQYKLKKLYGEQWSQNKPPNTFGKRFKQSVIAGQLPSVSPVAKAGDNAWMYKVEWNEIYMSGKK